MFIWRPNLLLLLVALFLISNCAPRYRKPAIDLNTVNIYNLTGMLEKNSERLHTLKGNARILVESPRMQYQGFSNILVKRPDSVFIKIKAFFGIDVGWFFSDKYSFAFYTPFQNTYYYGSLDSLALPYLSRFDLSFEQLLTTLVGITIPASLDSAHLITQGQDLILSGKLNEFNIKYLIDPQNGVVTQTEVFNQNGELTLREQFERITRIKDIVLPRTIRLESPVKEQSFLVWYTQLEVNEPIPENEFNFKIPENAIKIHL